MTASFYFQANTLQTKQKVKDYNTSLICIYHILICEASISNITPSDHEVCDGKHTSTTNQIFVTRVKSMQHTITHSKQDKNIEFYINLCKKIPIFNQKKLPSYWPLLGLYLFEGVFYAIYTIESQSSTVIQTCYTVAQPQQTRVISLYRDYCTKLSQSLDGMWSILNMFQLVQRIPNKPTNFLLSAIGCILITKL